MDRTILGVRGMGPTKWNLKPDGITPSILCPVVSQASVSVIDRPLATPSGLTTALRSKPSSRPHISHKILTLISRETTSGRFIPEMDGLRFVAISMVILFHLNGYLTAKSPLHYVAPPDTDWLARLALVGFHGVELFFVISGFMLGLPFASHYIGGGPKVSLERYYLRRLTRLEPPYFVTLLALFALAIWIQGKNTINLFPHLAASCFYLHNLIYGSSSPVIGVAWSLEIEVQFYLLVPVLTLLFAIRRVRLRRFVISLLTVSALSVQTVFLRNHNRFSLSILAYIQFFLIGFLLADVYVTDWKVAPRLRLYWDVAAAAGWPLLFIVLRSDTLTHWILPYLVFLLYYATFRGLLFNRFFTNSWVTAVGGMCYSIYLIHYEVISALGRVTKKITLGGSYWVHLLIQLVLVGPVIVLICGLYFIVLERPCMRRDWPKRLRNRAAEFILTKRLFLRSSRVGRERNAENFTRQTRYADPVTEDKCTYSSMP